MGRTRFCTGSAPDLAGSLLVGGRAAFSEVTGPPRCVAEQKFRVTGPQFGIVMQGRCYRKTVAQCHVVGRFEVSCLHDARVIGQVEHNDLPKQSDDVPGLDHSLDGDDGAVDLATVHRAHYWDLFGYQSLNFRGGES